jgi:hypothetical protein
MKQVIDDTKLLEFGWKYKLTLKRRDRKAYPIIFTNKLLQIVV